MEHDQIVAEGTGETFDIGSNGVSFVSGQHLKTGTFVELSISWPVLLEANTRMRLVVFGRLVRSDGHRSACTVDKYEFRTQARTTGTASRVRGDSMLRRWVEETRRDALKAPEALA